ncbi:ATP synthase subunit delta, chloroplastic [Gossypium australe]|uniref:ATP synthase subunit delta, chloroplastic n=1 Tax=Gossypium australe TaxID=47621 RepID=A0A5B6UYH2_9ROSI|nr:ATP synthase subunit delta, chloroplastic [Gossypium australe]
MEKYLLVLFLCVNLCFIGVNARFFKVPWSRRHKGISAVGDPGMKRDGLRIAFEAWNNCNGVAHEAPDMGSPRAADCFDVSRSKRKYFVHKFYNKLGIGKRFNGLSAEALFDPNLYATEKELYLGSLCEVSKSSKPWQFLKTSKPWQFWMVMLKSGNFDTKAGLCPENGKPKPAPINTTMNFPCFGEGCMNQPTLNHQPTQLLADGTMKGWFNGTYDLDADIGNGLANISFYEVAWEKKLGFGRWVFKHKLKTSIKYPWLMLYLRADATKGFSGGYPYETRGMLHTLPRTNFKVKFSLEIKKGGGPKSQFYLLDIGSCWKNNGKPCDGDVLTDVTRYSEMIINPDVPAWCSPTQLVNCPPYHITPNNTKILRNDTANFPYGAYHYYCAPGNAKYLEEPVSLCDPYSNPQPQELVQLLPHPAWGEYGYPTEKGQGWIGDPRTWLLDTGGLASRLYFYQDPDTLPAKRKWTSLDVGTEIFVSDKEEEAEWSLSDFDVILL